jgi:hypothetical protein
VINEDDYVPRPVRFLDFIVIGVGFIHNLARSIETLTGELFELSIYHANRKTETSQAWEAMAQDLETLGEDK